MQTKPDTFADLLALWETPKALSEALGLPYVNAQAMKRRRSIDVAHWPRIIELAAEKGVTVTNDDLVAMTIKRRAENDDDAARTAVEGHEERAA